MELARRAVRAIRRRINPPPPSGIPKREAVPFLPSNPVVVEAGAHIGQDTVEFARIWPKGQIHAFEPIPQLYEQLRERTAELPNVHCYQAALGEETGATGMWVSSGNTQSSSLLAPKTVRSVFPDIQFRKQIQVPVTTLDDWAARSAIQRVDFLWLDMQGYELEALKHAERMLTTVRAIILEVSIEELYEGCPLWPDVRSWLEDHGFTVARERIMRTFGDALVVRDTQ